MQILKNLKELKQHIDDSHGKSDLLTFIGFRSFHFHHYSCQFWKGP